MYMSAIRDGRCPVVLDRERKIIFDLNVLDEVNDKFGGFDKLAEKLNGAERAKNLRWLATLMLNEAMDEEETPLTEKQVGRMIHAGNLRNVEKAILGAISAGNRGDEQADEEESDDEGNARAGQVKE